MPSSGPVIDLLSLSFGSQQFVMDVPARDLPTLVRTHHLDVLMANRPRADNRNGAIWHVGFGIAIDSHVKHCVGMIFVDDVNDDGDLDIVFANRFEYSSGYAINSFLYRGDPGGANGIYSLLNRDVIATQGAWANDVEDLNGDGYRDIVFANRRGGTPNTTFVDSYIYWGSASGFSTSNRTELPTIGASDVSIGGQ